MPMIITEELLRNNFPPLIVKIAEKENYLNDFLNGKLYMNSAGYFRKVENNYRGDPFDGKRPLNSDLIHIVIENPKTKERLFFDKTKGLKDLTMGFHGDDMVPIFCATLITPEMLIIVNQTRCCIKKEYVDELTKFGKYFTVVNLSSLRNKLIEYNNAHAGDSYFLASPIEYFDIESSMSLKVDENHKMGMYQDFFRKRKEYRMQNEYRLVLGSSSPMISEGNDHLWVNIGKVADSDIIPIESLSSFTFSFETD
jgi:hypothetical protein